jgi:hypothetical protein
MTCSMGRSSSLLMALLLGCGGRGVVEEQPSGGGAGDAAATSAVESGPGPVSPPSCITDATLPAGAVVIACGFAPNLTLIGADAEAVYALTAAGQFYRVDTATHATTLVYTDNPDNPDNLPAALATVVSGGRIYFTGPATLGSNTDGVLSLDATQPSQPAVVVPSGVAGGPLVVLGSSIYYEHDDGSALDAVYGARLTGGPGTLVSQGDAWPVAGVDGFLYLAVPPNSGVGSPPYGQLVRVPAGGGSPTVVIDALDTPSGGDVGDGCLAVDSTYAYMLGSVDASLGDPVERYSVVAGGPPTTLARVPSGGGEIVIGAPSLLRKDGAYLYFLQTVEGDALSELERVSNVQGTPSQAPDVLLEAYVMGAPVFDATSLYVAYQRGGVTGPIEGTVLRLAK